MRFWKLLLFQDDLNLRLSVVKEATLVKFRSRRCTRLNIIRYVSKFLQLSFLEVE